MSGALPLLPLYALMALTGQLHLCPPASKFKDNERVCYPVGADYTPSIGFPYGGSSSPRLELVTG